MGRNRLADPVSELALMVLLNLLPVGLMQIWASVEHGTCCGREVGRDTISDAGMFSLGWFVVGRKTGWSIRTENDTSAQSDRSAVERGSPDLSGSSSDFDV